MEALVIIITLLILAVLLDINYKKIKEITNDHSLDYITKKLPSNKAICEETLKIVGRKVEIEEDENSNNSLYIVLTDKILLGKMKVDWVRVQTIAHECVHSTQNRKILLSNFILSNLYKLYFIVSVLLTIFGVFKNINLHLYILTLISFICIVIRNYLETNAMTKAEFIAEKYLNTTDLTQEEKDKLMNKYKELNSVGITLINYTDTLKDMAKPLIYTIAMLVV